jgi:hypothetical protein
MSKRKYSIAVMLATHKRTDALSRSVFSLLDHTKDLSCIQIIFGIDDNDEIGINHFVDVIQPELDRRGVDYTALSFEPLGYLGLNQYYNRMADEADADWLMVWCDDAIMMTQDWDQRVAECTGEFKLLKAHAHNEHPYAVFPIIPAEWREVTGYYARHQMLDAEVSQMAYMLDIMKIIEVDITHDRADLTGNNADETNDKKIMLEGNPNNPLDFHYPTLREQRLNDVEKISQYMNSKGLDTSWWEGVKLGKNSPWELMAANDPNGQTVQLQTIQDSNGRIHHRRVSSNNDQ